MADHGEPIVTLGSTPKANETEEVRLLRAINNKLGWAIAFLVLITLNTCGLADDIGDEIRGNNRSSAEQGDI